MEKPISVTLTANVLKLVTSMLQSISGYITSIIPRGIACLGVTFSFMRLRPSVRHVFRIPGPAPSTAVLSLTSGTIPISQRAC
jgi:hypothetical protein